MLPAFVQASSFREDFDIAAGWHVELGQTCVFRHALTIAGMLHIFSNATKDVYKVLDFWPMLYAGLKVLEPLVTHQDRLDKFMHTCLQGTAHDTKLFRKKAPHLYDKRWGEVHKFCLYLEPRLPIMEVTWDAAQFKDRGDPTSPSTQNP
jgi:hypothetical protein